ncbi:MAG: hypothetical protein OJF52_002935 [Nitrospira sp.]|jgi:hypothetical protein|nr:MAG: hypothetical protein OJF52_002935 [Nitrospira sp.]
MKLPGFTAGSTLYKTTRTYNSIGRSFVTPGNHGVLLQLPIGFCQANCDHISDPFLRSVCNLQCFDQGGGGGGAGRGGQFCRPGCGPCHRDPDSPTGRYKTCVKRNCDTYDVRC